MSKAMAKFAVAVIIIAMIFCGCTLLKENRGSIEYFQVSVKYAEENFKYSFSKNVYYTETSYAHYYFEPTVDSNSRQSCIEATDCIIAELEAVSNKPEIFIFSEESFDSVNILENSLYTHEADWKSVDYVANVILATYGEGCHYGLSYGYAAMICRRFNWESFSELTDCVPNVMEVYDLNLLCFDEAFVSENDIITARQTAYKFADYLKEQYGEETVASLLSLSKNYEGMGELSKELEKFYWAQGIVYSPAQLCFCYGGMSCDYVLKSELADFYIGAEWTDTNCEANPLISENFLHESYRDTREFFECNLAQMESYQRLFDLDSYDNSLTVIFPNTKSDSYSCYQSGYHRIFAYNIDSLMHEYIHSLTNPGKTQSLWETEGFARYFSYFYDYYGIAFLNEDYNNAAETSATGYLYEYKATIDRPVDMQIDFYDIENIAVYSRGYTDPNESYVAGSSFVQYLVREYGETFVAQCIYGDESDFPKSYSELVNDWNRYIEENYSGFSRYIK